MKKFLAIILVILLVCGIGCGAYFGIKACNNEKSTDINNTTYNETMLEEKYTVGDMVIFNFYAYSDIEFVGITYKINNGQEQNITGFKTGSAEEHKNYDGEEGDYYIDTTAQIIDTSAMTPGYYTIVFSGIAKDGGVYQINTSPYMFQLVAVQTAA